MSSHQDQPPRCAVPLPGTDAQLTELTPTSSLSQGPVARPVCLLGLKPSPHRKWAVAALCVLDMVAQSLVLEADLEPSTTSEKQELAGIYETWLPVPLVGKDE